MCLNVLAIAVSHEIAAALEEFDIRTALYDRTVTPDELRDLADPDFVDAILIDTDRTGKGADMARTLRARSVLLPVIALTSLSRISGFSDLTVELMGAGADYVTHVLAPPKEIAAILSGCHARRMQRYATDHRRIVRGSVTIEVSLLGKTVRKNGEVLRMTAGMRSILHTLFEHQGQIVTRVQLDERIREHDPAGDSNSVEVLICRLRKALSNGDGVGMQIIETHRGMGYMIPADTH